MAELDDFHICVLDACMRKRLVVVPIDVGEDRVFATPAGRIETEKISVVIYPGGVISTEGQVSHTMLRCIGEPFFHGIEWLRLPEDMDVLTEKIFEVWERHWAQRVEEIHRRMYDTCRKWRKTRIEFEVVVALDTFGYWAAGNADRVVDLARVRAAVVGNKEQ